MRKIVDVQTGAVTSDVAVGEFPTTFTIEEERARMVCSLIQAKVALDGAGLLTAADTAVSAAGGLTALAWTSANELERNSPTVATLQTAMSLSDTQVDDLFRAAMQVKL